MIINDVIMNIYNLSFKTNTKISLKMLNLKELDVLIDSVSIGTITNSNGSVFYEDWIDEKYHRDLERREYFLNTLKYERVLRIRKSRRRGNMTTIYKITGVRNE